MRRIIVVAGLLLGIALLGTATPRLSVSEEMYEFGEVVDGAVVEHTFVLTNTGTSEVRITRASWSCGCTSVSPSLRNVTLAPGRSLDVRVTFRTRGYSAPRYTQPVSTRVTIHSNASNAPQLPITVRGYVRATEAEIRHRPTTEDVQGEFGRSVAELNNSLYLLVDVRDSRDFARNRLLGAVSIPGGELLARLDDLPRGRMIYVYDDTGSWATHAVRTLRDRDYPMARSIAGGLVRWHSDVGDALYDWTASNPSAVPAGRPYSGEYSVPPSQLLRPYNVIVDIRPREAFARGHLPGSLNLHPEEASTWGPNLPQTDQLPSGAEVIIWVVDQDGSQACSVAQELRAMGNDGIFCLTGGLDEWRARYGTSLLWTQ